jgi:hypothetical protein
MAEMKKKGRCWKGYKPKPGAKPYSKGSCIPEGANPVEDAEAADFGGKPLVKNPLRPKGDNLVRMKKKGKVKEGYGKYDDEPSGKREGGFPSEKEILSANDKERAKKKGKVKEATDEDRMRKAMEDEERMRKIKGKKPTPKALRRIPGTDKYVKEGSSGLKRLGRAIRKDTTTDDSREKVNRAVAADSKYAYKSADSRSRQGDKESTELKKDMEKSKVTGLDREDLDFQKRISKSKREKSVREGAKEDYKKDDSDARAHDTFDSAEPFERRPYSHNSASTSDKHSFARDQGDSSRQRKKQRGSKESERSQDNRRKYLKSMLRRKRSNG